MRQGFETAQTDLRSAISKVMNCSRKRGLIDYKGDVMVHPSRLNAALQDE
jgi:hypothetical protein